MPLIGLARLEFGRDRPTNPKPEFGRAPQRIAPSDSNPGDNYRENSRRQTPTGSFPPFDNDDGNSRPALSSRNTVEGDGSRANNRRRTRLSSLSPSDNDDGNGTSPFSRSILGADDDDEISLGGTEARGPPTRRVTEPPPYRTVESLALRSDQDSTRSIAQRQENRDNGRSQGSRTQNSSGAAFMDFMKNLQSRVLPSDRQDAANPAAQSRNDGFNRSPGRRLHPLTELTEHFQDIALTLLSNRQDAANPAPHLPINMSERRPGRIADSWTPFTDFLQDLHLTLFRDEPGASIDVRETQIRPRGTSETVTTTRRRHRRSGKRSHDHLDSSDDDSSDSSDSDNAADDNGLVKITKTYRPVGRGSSSRDGCETFGMLRRTVTEAGREIMKGAQKVAVARMAAGSREDKERRSGGLNDQKPHRQGSYLLELALRAGQRKD